LKSGDTKKPLKDGKSKASDKKEKKEEKVKDPDRKNKDKDKDSDSAKKTKKKDKDTDTDDKKKEKDSEGKSSKDKDLKKNGKNELTRSFQKSPFTPSNGKKATKIQNLVVKPASTAKLDTAKPKSKGRLEIVKPASTAKLDLVKKPVSRAKLVPAPKKKPGQSSKKLAMLEDAFGDDDSFMMTDFDDDFSVSPDFGDFADDGSVVPLKAYRHPPSVKKPSNKSKDKSKIKSKTNVNGSTGKSSKSKEKKPDSPGKSSKITTKKTDKKSFSKKKKNEQ
jgi:hypothetical protein